jgi:UDP-MurNAc hydroxylase
VKLLWVNHASFVVEADPIRLITDPWIEGTAFNHGWRLLADTKFRYEDFAGITHIWFSHEHPDHFSPPNLRRIPEELRRRITVLFHETRDRRVLQFCESLGFRVQELPLNRRVELAPEVSILCGPQGSLDSWMAFTASGQTLLNMNDCVFDDIGSLAAIKKHVGGVDLLLSQFSFATWVGNEGDFASHRRHAADKLKEMARQIGIFAPRWFIPFASYIFFSHAENFYMNGACNRIGDVYRYAQLELGCDTVVLFPGDTWELGASHDSSQAIRAYADAFEAALARTPDPPHKVSMEELQRLAHALTKKSDLRNNRLLLRLLPSAVVRLTDLGMDVEFSYRRGLRQVKGNRALLSMSSDSLLYCIEFDWGGNALEINGRFQVLPQKDPEWFFRLLRIPQRNAAGERLEQLVAKKAASWLCDVVRP